MLGGASEIKAEASVGLTAEQLRSALDELCAIEPAFAAARARIGDPEPRIRPPGFETMIRAIVGQQVSTKAAAAILARVEAAAGGIGDPAKLAATSDEALRAAGLSGQKVAYVKSLAEEVLSGRLDLANLPADDEEILAMVRVKGIGRWSAEVYLLFAEGRTDVWPAGDLAVRQEVGRILGLDGHPSEKRVRELAEAWRPHRGAAAIFAWHHRHIEAL
jgi:DNA-3-methyladenine glycosylase II